METVGYLQTFESAGRGLEQELAAVIQEKDTLEKVVHETRRDMEHGREALAQAENALASAEQDRERLMVRLEEVVSQPPSPQQSKVAERAVREETERELQATKEALGQAEAATAKVRADAEVSCDKWEQTYETLQRKYDKLETHTVTQQQQNVVAKVEGSEGAAESRIHTLQQQRDVAMQEAAELRSQLQALGNTLDLMDEMQAKSLPAQACRVDDASTTAAASAAPAMSNVITKKKGVRGGSGGMAALLSWSEDDKDEALSVAPTSATIVASRDAASGNLGVAAAFMAGAAADSGAAHAHLALLQQERDAAVNQALIVNEKMQQIEETLQQALTEAAVLKDKLEQATNLIEVRGCAFMCASICASH